MKTPKKPEPPKKPEELEAERDQQLRTDRTLARAILETTSVGDIPLEESLAARATEINAQEQSRNDKRAIELRRRALEQLKVKDNPR